MLIIHRVRQHVLSTAIREAGQALSGGKLGHEGAGVQLAIEALDFS
jgi:hypothetical protein